MRRLRPLLRAALSVTALALSAGGAAAQGGPPALPEVRWEPVGLDSFRVTGLVFAAGPAPDGSLDTLYAVDLVRGAFERPHPDPDRGNSGPHRLPPGGAWSGDLCEACIPDVIARTARGTLLVGAGTGITDVDRSSDGGATWELDVHDGGVNCFYAASAALDRDVFACGRNGPVLRSPDGAAGTWEALGLVEPANNAMHALALTEALAGPALPGPRLVAGVLGGIAYSDDGGRTWAKSSMWENFRWNAEGGLGRHAVAGHPYGGVLYAGVRDHGYGWPTVYASEDGGRTWALRSSGPDMTETRFTHAVIAVDSGGGVWLGTDRSSGIDFTTGEVLWSGDGARTWAPASAGLVDAAVEALVFGRDGRLYAATDKGVWRTASPVPVASEGGPRAEPAPVGVSVWPNPSGGRVTVGLTLGAPQVVRVTVVDALGREVAVVHEGAAADGQRVSVDTAGWPAGGYTVRVETEAGRASAGLTVVR